MENVYREYSTHGIMKRYKIISNKNDKDVYLLGYLAGDGSYITDRSWPFMSVNSTEKYIVDYFRDEYCPDSEVYYEGIKSSNLVNAVNPVHSLRFPAKFSIQLAAYGIFVKKPSRRFVGVPKTMLAPYIAGLIDSDGFISVSHRKDTREPRLRWFITHAAEKFLVDIQNALEISTTIRQHGSNVWRLQAQNTEHNKSFLYRLLPYLRNRKKRYVLSNYLANYYVPQASGELLEG